MAFASALRWQSPLQRHLHTYDIGCKYKVHFQERVTRSLLGSDVEVEASKRGSLPKDVLIAPNDFPNDFAIKVPSWHVLGHVASCILANNLRYTPLVGRTAGEGVETIWSTMNAHQYATREMTHGHRRDALTDIFNDYNWKKLCGESESMPRFVHKYIPLTFAAVGPFPNQGRRLSSAYFDACQMYNSKTLQLREIEETIGQDKVVELTKDAERRGSEQYGAQVAKGLSKMFPSRIMF